MSIPCGVIEGSLVTESSGGDAREESGRGMEAATEAGDMDSNGLANDGG